MANYKIKDKLILGDKVESSSSKTGTRGYYYGDVSLKEKQIKLFPIETNAKGTEYSGITYNGGVLIQDSVLIDAWGDLGIPVGAQFTLVNGTHYAGYAYVSGMIDEVLCFEYNDSEKPFPFTEILDFDGDNIHGMTWMIYFPDYPEVGAAVVGDSARAYGKETSAIASNSIAEGKRTKACGNGSRASGKETIALGNYSSSLGYQTKTIGHQSIAAGKLSVAEGNSSMALGTRAIAFGESSFASGSGCEAIGDAATATGYQTKAQGHYSFTEGFQTIVELDPESSMNSRGGHAEGVTTIARGAGTHAQNIDTQAIANGASASGRGSIASGKYSSANNDSTTASGESSFSIGLETTAQGKYSFAGGKGSTATGFESFAFGHNATAGEYAFALGYNANASKFSTAIGRNCKVTGNYQVAVGVNNDFAENMLFMIGNGIDESGNLTSRNNAFTVYKNGDTKTGRLYISQESTVSDAIGKNDVANIANLRNGKLYSNNDIELKIGAESAGLSQITLRSEGIELLSDETGAATILSVKAEGITARGNLITTGELIIGGVRISGPEIRDLLKILKNNPGLVEGTNITATDDAVTLA